MRQLIPVFQKLQPQFLKWKHSYTSAVFRRAGGILDDIIYKKGQYVKSFCVRAILNKKNICGAVMFGTGAFDTL